MDGVPLGIVRSWANSINQSKSDGALLGWVSLGSWGYPRPGPWARQFQTQGCASEAEGTLGCQSHGRIR